MDKAISMSAGRAEPYIKRIARKLLKRALAEEAPWTGGLAEEALAEEVASTTAS